jgi:hypothetical protein
MMPQIKLRLDPWPAEYESSFLVEELQGEADEKVDTAVEGAWQAIPAQQFAQPELILFVDGVRRIDARVIAEDDSGKIIRGAFGSIGVGAVRVSGEEATFETLLVKRYLVVDSGLQLEPETIEIGQVQLIFEAYPVSQSGPMAPATGLQDRMRVEEALLAESLSKQSLYVFADGPLTYFSGIKQTAFGVIKTLVKPYLSEQKFKLVRTLHTGERTPLFVIQGKYSRYSWYLRVGSQRPIDHDVAGVIRLEVRSDVGLERARELANISAACIPAFAGEWFRDARAPQNLLPVSCLEQQLRHRLGDALSIRRAIEMKLFSTNES